MNKLLILISVILGSASLYFAGPVAGVSSFVLGFISSILYERGKEKMRVNGVAEIARKQEPNHNDIFIFGISWMFLLMGMAIVVASYMGN